MSFDFDALAERAATVKVGGKPVHLRLPTPEAKIEVVKSTIPPKTDSPTEASEITEAEIQEAIHRWNVAAGKALAACVVGHDKMTEEKWVRVATATGTPYDEDIKKLVRVAMALCGLKLAMDALEKMDTDSEGEVEDHVAAADQTMGNSPTK